MSVSAMNWALNTSEPASELHHGVGSIYRPMAKLLLLSLSDNCTNDTESSASGYIDDFPALCSSLWLHPEMGTMVLEQMANDGLLTMKIIERQPPRPNPADRFHDGTIESFVFTLDLSR